MAHRIIDDWTDFRNIISGKYRDELKKYMSNGSIFKLRGKNGKISITLPRINLPHITFGKPQEGVGRGPGNDGDVIGRDGDGQGGNKPGTDPGEGITINVDLDEILKLLKDELQLPDMKPKPNQTYEEIRTIYNGISKVGPNSLLHKRKTLRQTMKRMSAMGGLEKKVVLPGLNTPVSILSPINDDRRYRQYNEIKVPSSNAVLFFMRDGSGSMDKEKCDIVSDISWWIDLYVQKFYKKTERVYLWHDTEAKEVSEKMFYNLRYGGGTIVTSVLKLMSKIVKHRYNPVKWNIYGFYFGDGESFGEDNKHFADILKTKLGPDVVNMFGQVEILHYSGWGDSLKAYLDKRMAKGNLPHVRNTSIDRPKDGGWGVSPFASEEARDQEVKRVIKELLGKETIKTKATLVA